MESEFRATFDKDLKESVLRQIAGWNNADAVSVLARLFSSERHRDSRQAVLVALGDVDPSEGVPERLVLLAAACQNQPRAVRLVALDLLESVDDPRATDLIQQMVRNDPDREVRDAAKAIYNSRASADR